MEADLLCELGEDVNEQGLPPGFRFHPTDEELITFYLSSKVFNSGVTSNTSFIVPRITEVDLNRCEPWDLPEAARTGEREWYLFSLRDRKYPTGLRTNRATGAGYWKATGKDKEVFAGGLMIGMKKTLVFYKGRAPRGDKTRWVMHEFRLDGHLMMSSRHPPFTVLYSISSINSDMSVSLIHFFALFLFQEEWVICRVYHKIGEKTKNPASALLRGRGGGGRQTDFKWPWADMMLSSSSTPTNYNNHANILNPPLFHHPPPPPQDQEEAFLHINKLIRTLNPVAVPDPFSMPELMNNDNNKDIIQLLPAACHNNKRIVDRQTNNCMSHRQDLLHHASISTTTTVPKQLFMKTEETSSCLNTPGQLMMVHPPDANDPYYQQQQQQLYHGNIIDFGFFSSINDVALAKNCPHFM